MPSKAQERKKEQEEEEASSKRQRPVRPKSSPRKTAAARQRDQIRSNGNTDSGPAVCSYIFEGLVPCSWWRHDDHDHDGTNTNTTSENFYGTLFWRGRVKSFFSRLPSYLRSLVRCFPLARFPHYVRPIVCIRVTKWLIYFLIFGH